jgi:hypothetical protein
VVFGIEGRKAKQRKKKDWLNNERGLVYERTKEAAFECKRS